MRAVLLRGFIAVVALGISAGASETINSEEATTSTEQSHHLPTNHPPPPLRPSPLKQQEEEDLLVQDDRTLLDVFGEVAKEYLTHRVIPPTDEACRWDWRYARCEPFCDCALQFQWGDYHLGRACRRRSDNNTPPLLEENDEMTCTDEPPDHAYVHMIQALIKTSQSISQQTKQTARRLREESKETFRRMQNDVCSSLPEECSEDDSEDENHRNWKQRILCRHIPSPCDENEHDDDKLAFPWNVSAAAPLVVGRTQQEQDGKEEMTGALK